MEKFKLPEGLELITDEKDLQQYRGGALAINQVEWDEGDPPEDPPNSMVSPVSNFMASA